MHYRVPFFNQLAEKLSRPIAVIAGSYGSELDENEFKFDVQKLPIIKRGPFRTVKNLNAMADRSAVHILPFDLHEWPSLRSTMRRKSPLILWGHSHGSRGFLKPFRRWMANRSDAIVVYTQPGKDQLVKEGLDSSKVFVANNTVDISNAGFDDSVQRTSFLFSGRITERKKVDEALQAFAKIKNEIPDQIGFEIVGDGPERSALEQMAADLDLASRVTFHGSIYDPEQLKTIFQRSLAFVSPGHVGLGVLHSFAYGVPPLTRRHANHAPEFQHIRENENGLLFDGTIGDLAVAMKNLCERDLSRTLGQNGSNYYTSHCTLDNATQGMIDAINFAQRRDGV